MILGNSWLLDRTPVILAVAIHMLVFVIGAWDICALYSGRADATVSSVIGRWSHEMPVLPLFVGLLLGHLFWPRR
jgi:hypothetical protein